MNAGLFDAYHKTATVPDDSLALFHPQRLADQHKM